MPVVDDIVPPSVKALFIVGNSAYIAASMAVDVRKAQSGCGG